MCHAADTHLFSFQEPGRSRQHCRAVLGYPGLWWRPSQVGFGPNFKEIANILVAPLIKGFCCLKFANKWALALCHLYCLGLQSCSLCLSFSQSRNPHCSAVIKSHLLFVLGCKWANLPPALLGMAHFLKKSAETLKWTSVSDGDSLSLQPTLHQMLLYYQHCTWSVCVHKLGWDMQAMAGEGHGKSISKYLEYFMIQYERWESFTGCNSQKRAIPWVDWHFWAHLNLAMEKLEVWASLSEAAVVQKQFKVILAVFR